MGMSGGDRSAWWLRLSRLVPALWFGALLVIGGVATPAPFTTLAAADAARVVARVLANEAYLSLALGIGVLLLAKAAARQASDRGAGSLISTDMLLVLGTLVCTIAGYFVVQPMMAAARAGQGSLSFGQLHAISGGMFVVKVGLVAALAWRATKG